MVTSISHGPIKITEIVSAASSVLSVVVAAIAASFAYRAYRKQAGQLELALKHDRTWQAAKVTAWVHDIAKLDAVSSLLIDPQQDSDVTRALDYINASDLPVYSVRVIYVDSDNNSRVCKRISKADANRGTCPGAVIRASSLPVKHFNCKEISGIIAGRNA